MGSHLGILKVAAKRIGISFDDYLSHVNRGNKWCHKCKSWRNVRMFGSDRTRYDGLDAVCHNCRCKPDRSSPNKAERAMNAMLGLSWCGACKKWMAADIIHGGKCQPCHSSYARNRYATNEVFRLTARQKSHARKRNVDPIPGHAQKMIMEEFGGMCAYCQIAAATTWDHIEPISKGGRTTPENVVPACVGCNSSKSNRDVFEWMEHRGIVPSEAFIDRHVLAYAGLYG